MDTETTWGPRADALRELDRLREKARRGEVEAAIAVDVEAFRRHRAQRIEFWEMREALLLEIRIEDARKALEAATEEQTAPSEDASPARRNFIAGQLQDARVQLDRLQAQLAARPNSLS